MMPTLHDDALRFPTAYPRLLGRSHQAGFPMNSDALTGALLRTLVAAKPGGEFLELGTGCGLGTCWLLDGMSAGSSLVSVDTDAGVQAIAREELGDDRRLTLVLQEGGEYLDTCDRRFDLIYADTWPGKYSHLSRALEVLNAGGMYVIDDMLPQANWPAGHAPKVDALLATLDRLDGFAITKLSWSTGIVICVKR